MGLVMSNLIIDAEQFARERHEGQFRKGYLKEPYSVHLEEVARLCKSWGAEDNVIAAAWLHDTVEDCPPTSIDEIKAIFNENIANIVDELTDKKSLSKSERKQSQINNAAKKSYGASLVILADKTSNVGSIIHSPPKHWSFDRQQSYIVWAHQVIELLPNVPAEARQQFVMLCDQAKFILYDTYLAAPHLKASLS
jgi:(p)ppGpp synthase/HD superfamily hydrolase